MEKILLSLRAFRAVTDITELTASTWAFYLAFTLPWHSLICHAIFRLDLFNFDLILMPLYKSKIHLA